MVVISIKVPDK